MRELKGHTGFVLGLTFTPNGKHLVSASADHTARLWDLADGSSRPLIREQRDWIAAVACSPDGKSIAVGGHNGRVFLKPVTGEGGRKKTFTCDDSVSALVFSPGGELLACGGYAKQVNLLSGASLKEMERLSGSLGLVYALAFSPDGSRLAVGDDSGSIKLFDVATWALHAELPHDDRDGCRSLACTPDGRFLLAALGCGVMRWDLTGPGNRANLFAGHTDVVSCASISPDGRSLLSGSWDGTVRLWDLATRGERPSYNWDIGRKVFDVTFSPDGMTAAAAGSSSTIIVWVINGADGGGPSSWGRCITCLLLPGRLPTCPTSVRQATRRGRA
jgi:WD40 repeat protein